MTRQPHEMIGPGEIAEMLGVSRQYVLELRKKKADFPKPARYLLTGVLFDADEIEAWFLADGRKFTAYATKDSPPE